MYTALVLTPESELALRTNFRSVIPAGWDVKCHHMTINMSHAASGPAAALVGQTFPIEVVSLASDQNVIAVGVDTQCPSVNAVKHITVAVNTAGGGKPKHSNLLQKWSPLPSKLTLTGVVQEVA